MKRLATSIALIPALSYAGTSDPGVAGVIFGAITLAFVLWGGLAFVVAQFLPARSTLRVVIAIFIALAPIAYWAVQSYSYEKGLEDLKRENEQLVSSATLYLQMKCAQGRKIVAAKALSSHLWVRIETGPYQPLLDEIPPAKPETPRMKRDQERYGESFPKDINKIQYLEPVYWVENPGVLEKARSEDHPIVVIGKVKNQFSEDQARYVLSFQDISTIEDRAHWVAKAQIKLTELATREVVAEYVGFSANEHPAFMPKTAHAWEHIKPCPGKEQSYQSRTSWQALDFFFNEVVRYDEQKLK